jgi:hypothetical protein
MIVLGYLTARGRAHVVIEGRHGNKRTLCGIGVSRFHRDPAPDMRLCIHCERARRAYRGEIHELER